MLSLFHSELSMEIVNVPFADTFYIGLYYVFTSFDLSIAIKYGVGLKCCSYIRLQFCIIQLIQISVLSNN